MYKALIVDDEKMIRMGIKAALPWQSFKVDEVYTAATGMEALTIVEENHPDLMITDINMTEMTGLELIERIRNIQPDIKIIVLTGYDEFDYAHQCLRMKVEDFFLKPVDEEEIGRAIKKIIDGIELSNDLEQQQKFVIRAQGVTEQLVIERIMRNLVHSREEQEDLAYLAREYSFTTDFTMQLAIVVPTIQMELDSNEVNYINLSIKNICIDLFDAQGEGITFEDNDGKLMIAIFENTHSDEIINRIGLLKNILKDEYNITSKVVVGGPVKEFDKLKISYNDAIYLLETEKENIQEIIQTRFSEERYRIFNEVFLELKRIMIMNSGNVDSIMKAYSTFSQAAESYNLATTMIKRCCIDIASTLYFSYICNTGENIDNKLNSLLNSLMNAEKEDVLAFTADFITQLFNGEDENIHEIISKSKAYIREHLAEDLSVSSLAAELFITPNYFSRLFKKVTGEGCSEYIVRKRIEKAKALLESTSLKTGKIAYMVGYNDTNYFSLAFKKYIGISPTKYRDSFMAPKKTT